MEKMTTEITSFKCNWCNALHKKEHEADECAFIHARENLANSLLKDGYTLLGIKYKCGYNWNLTEDQKDITKDSCFIVSHWQCCEKPAYKIIRFDERGNPVLWGKGSWSGYYGHAVEINNLPKPHPASELFIDPR